MAASCRASAVVCGPAFQACGIAGGSVSPGHGVEVDARCKNDAVGREHATRGSVTRAVTGSIRVTSSNTMRTP